MHVKCLKDLGMAEVTQFEGVVLLHDVGGLDVPMDDTVVLELGEGFQEVLDKSDGLVLCQFVFIVEVTRGVGGRRYSWRVSPQWYSEIR